MADAAETTDAQPQQGAPARQEPRIRMSGVKRAAVLLISLDQELAARVLSQLDSETIERVSLEIARLQEVEPAERKQVLEDFFRVGLAHRYVEQGGIDYARAILERSLSPEDASRILQQVEESIRKMPFAFLQKADPDNLLTFIQGEHPQTIALIMAHLGRNKAAEILRGLDPRKQIEVVKRVANMETTSPEVIRQVEKSLEKRLSSIVMQELQETGGIESVAEILNLTERATERAILENLEDEDPDLVDQIRRRMFVFEDILLVNDRGIQNVLKEIDNDLLAMALKTASDELKEKIFKNMSQRAADLVREEMEYMGPVRISDVENSQQEIVEVVRRLEESGDVIIHGRGGDEEIVA